MEAEATAEVEPSREVAEEPEVQEPPADTEPNTQMEGSTDAGPLGALEDAPATPRADKRGRDEAPASPDSPSKRRTAQMESLADVWEDQNKREVLKRKAETDGEEHKVGLVEWVSKVIDPNKEFPSVDDEDCQVNLDDVSTNVGDDDADDESWDWDDEDEGKIIVARQRELDQMVKYGVYELKPRGDPSLAEYKQLSTRWVDQRRGEEWRCRIVAREFKFLDPDMEGLFTVATAPVTGRIMDFFATQHGYKRVIGDATNAYFNTPQNRLVYALPPPELRQRLRDQGLDDDVVMVLRKKLYGERDASVEFGDHFAGLFSASDFDRCPQCPQFHFHKAMQVLVEIHQDDIHMAGPDEGLVATKAIVDKQIPMKWSKLLGVGDRYSFLKNHRVVLANGTFLFANGKYARDIIKSLGLENAKPAPTPIVMTRLPTDVDKLLKDQRRSHSTGTQCQSGDS